MLKIYQLNLNIMQCFHIAAVRTLFKVSRSRWWWLSSIMVQITHVYDDSTVNSADCNANNDDNADNEKKSTTKKKVKKIPVPTPPAAGGTDKPVNPNEFQVRHAKDGEGWVRPNKDGEVLLRVRRIAGIIGQYCTI